ncbi:uncharacterized protein LOC122848112 isoform X2 [Aphidius gifuensis]|nr:uncharacterized protein LOC122848112 isoform X2 [Aphidius gifuensis]XP_044001887.1 uncharacterized protein LOC122848112 isoform X2 [Aphidius gifuensis]
MYSQPTTTFTEMLSILIWTYWYLWAAILAGLTLAAVCGCWLWQRRNDDLSDDGNGSERASSTSCYAPPHYSRCSSFVQALPPPYNEVTSKPDLYPLVIGFDEGIGKGPSGFVMRYFRTLSHASTLDSLSSSFMCNVVNEANTIIPPPYSCNNSIDELSVMECDRGGGGGGGGDTCDGGSIVSLGNNRTTSDISSLAAQSPCSPPRATSPTIELRELLDKIQQLPHENSYSSYQSRPSILNTQLNNNQQQQQQQQLTSPNDCPLSRMRRARGKMYMPLGQSSIKSKNKRWLSRSAPTTPSGTIPMTLLPGQSSMRPSDLNDNYNQQAVPLLSEQDENIGNNVLTEQEEETQQL